MAALLVTMIFMDSISVSAKESEAALETEAVLPADDPEATPYFKITNAKDIRSLTMGKPRRITHETNWKNIKYSSSNKSYCTVDSSGLLTPKKVYLGGYDESKIVYITISGTGPDGATHSTRFKIENILFSDVNQVSDQPYYFNPVYWAVSRGIANGYKNADGSLTGKFEPDKKCTRGEVVTFLYRAAGSPSVNTVGVTKFKDVKSSDFYYTAVCWAVKNGITTGYTENGKPTGYFGPNDTCTRGQVMTFMYRAAGSPEISSGVYLGFVDVSRKDYYYKPILWATMNNITTGYTGTGFSGKLYFGPNDPCTRGQVVTFLWRKEGSPAPAAVD